MVLQLAFGAFLLVCAANGLSGVVFGKCISAGRKRPGQATWNNLPRVIHGSDARTHGIAFLGLALFIGYAMVQILSGADADP